jgi:hypothetical protein
MFDWDWWVKRLNLKEKLGWVPSLSGEESSRNLIPNRFGREPKKSADFNINWNQSALDCLQRRKLLYEAYQLLEGLHCRISCSCCVKSLLDCSTNVENSDKCNNEKSLCFVCRYYNSSSICKKGHAVKLCREMIQHGRACKSQQVCPVKNCQSSDGCSMYPYLLRALTSWYIESHRSQFDVDMSTSSEDFPSRRQKFSVLATNYGFRLLQDVLVYFICMYPSPLHTNNYFLSPLPAHGMQSKVHAVIGSFSQPITASHVVQHQDGFSCWLPTTSTNFG